MITSVPALVKVLGVFALVLVLNRTRLKLSYCLIAGALVLGLWTGMKPCGLVLSITVNLARFETISLVLIVGLILVMSRLMKDSGQLDRIVERFSCLARDARTIGAVMPALIGLLPMPGGALFSAPMVDAALCGAYLSGEKKTVVNYWFRHIWEYWWPLYPGVVLAVALLHVEIWRFMAVMLPMTVITVMAGIVFILLPLERGGASVGKRRDFKALGRFLWEIMPILVVVAVIILVAVLTAILHRFGWANHLPGGAAILPGLAVALIWVCVVNRIPLKKFWSSFLERETLPMILLVAAIMIFKGVMNDSQAVSHIRDELVAYRFPALWIILLMPFLSGLITGIAIGFVGASFPLIIPLFPASSTVEYLAYALVAYSFGYMGMMLSPVHLCFLVTKDYFRASLVRSYWPLILPVVTVLISALILSYLLTRVTQL